MKLFNLLQIIIILLSGSNMFHRLQERAVQSAVALSAGSAYLLFGYDQVRFGLDSKVESSILTSKGVLGGLVSQPSFLSAIGNPSSAYLGTIVALYDIGCLAGCIVAAIWGNRFGRRHSIFWASIIMVIGAIIQATTYGPAQLIAGRLISGVGNGTVSFVQNHTLSVLTALLTFRLGINTSAVPMYVSETSRTEIRGRSLAIQMSLVIVCLSGSTAAWLSDDNSSAQC